jgi:hypothetical protein
MTTKTPFEIRADLIKQAQEHLEKQYMANLKFTTEAYMKLVDAGTATVENFPKFPYFTTKDILEQAQEFYSFVTKK